MKHLLNRIRLVVEVERKQQRALRTSQDGQIPVRVAVASDPQIAEGIAFQIEMLKQPDFPVHAGNWFDEVRKLEQ